MMPLINQNNLDGNSWYVIRFIKSILKINLQHFVYRQFFKIYIWIQKVLGNEQVKGYWKHFLFFIEAYKIHVMTFKSRSMALWLSFFIDITQHFSVYCYILKKFICVLQQSIYHFFCIFTLFLRFVTVLILGLPYSNYYVKDSFINGLENIEEGKKISPWVTVINIK